MDVKPTNIFITMEGAWKLGDFGSCVNANTSIYSTTLSFLPKEFEKADKKLDYYMLGATGVVKAFPKADFDLNGFFDDKKAKELVLTIKNIELQQLILELLGDVA